MKFVLMAMQNLQQIILLLRPKHGETTATLMLCLVQGFEKGFKKGTGKGKSR